MGITYKIEEIRRLIMELIQEAVFNREQNNEQYAQGIDYCIEKIKEILDK